jgi:hypothetical protein
MTPAFQGLALRPHTVLSLTITSAFAARCCLKKVDFRYRQAEIAGIAVVERLERTVGIASSARWLLKAHVAEQFGVEKPTQKLQSFFSRWSIKFSAEYCEAKEQQASDVLSFDHIHALEGL